MRRRSSIRLLVILAALAVLTALSPWLVRAFWWHRASNPVRRGLVRAQELGCFHCHGELGERGLPLPPTSPPASADESTTGEHAVPAWAGGVWMMYVDSDEKIEQYILHGGPDGPQEKHDPRNGPAAEQDHPRALRMPAYESVLGGSDLDDLVALFNAASGRKRPPTGSAAARGRKLAEHWRCFDCHGPAGCGGLANPGSFTGFIPGWYGPDFQDLVRDRTEFDRWIRTGTLPRLRSNRVATFFLRRQRIQMPAYALEEDGLDDLWAYAQWLAETGGSVRAEPSSW